MLSAGREKNRIHNRLPVAREGIPFILTGAVLTLVFTLGGFPVVAVVAGLLTLFTGYFFRDPPRATHVDDKTILTPADGRILCVLPLSGEDSPLGGAAMKISVFMSIFNVHVNRIPVSGRISKITYHPGRFVSAHLDKASHENENNRIALETTEGRQVVFVQIAGLIARRIACWIREEDYVRAGQRFGLIRFGSRLDIYLPMDSRIVARPRDRVRAGETILGYLS